MSASPQTATDGSRFSLIGSFGEGFSHAAGDNQVLTAPMKRVYDGFLEPLKLDPSITNNLSLDGGDMGIVIPGGVVSQPYEAMVEMDPINKSITAPLSTFQQAIQQLVAIFGSYVSAPIAAVELRILLADNTILSQELSSAVEFSLRYTDRGDGGKFHIYRLDESGSNWSSAQGIFDGGLAHFSQYQTGLFAVFQQGPVDVGRAYAFPVPWRPNGNNAALYGTLQDGITFTNTPTTGLITIYNIAGEMVRDIVIPPGSLQLRWDGKTGSGNDVASGVYIWSVESEGNRKTGKLMIIR